MLFSFKACKSTRTREHTHTTHTLYIVLKLIIYSNDYFFSVDNSSRTFCLVFIFVLLATTLSNIEV